MAQIVAGCAAPVAVAIAGYAADGGLLLTTGKSSTDHLISMNSNKDCGAFRALTKGQPLCKDLPEGTTNPYHVDYTAPFRSEGDSGVEVVRSGRDGGTLLTGDPAREAMEAHKTPVFPASSAPPSTATAAVPGEARFGSAGQPAVAPTPEGAVIATAGSRTPARKH